MSVGTLIYSQTPRNLMIDPITKGSRPFVRYESAYISPEKEEEEEEGGREVFYQFYISSEMLLFSGA